MGGKRNFRTPPSFFFRENMWAGIVRIQTIFLYRYQYQPRHNMQEEQKWDSTQPVITQSNRLIAAICAAEVRKTDTAADQPNTEQKWNK